jgi:hypothetical protein
MAWFTDFANTMRAVKSDQVSQRLQDEFFGLAEKPRETKQ